jgi:hypothetical protein
VYYEMLRIIGSVVKPEYTEESIGPSNQSGKVKPSHPSKKMDMIICIVVKLVLNCSRPILSAYLINKRH